MQALNGQLEVDSVEAQEASVQPWDVKLRQVQAGSFRGKLEFALIGDIMIYRDNWSRRTVATGALPEAYFAVCAGVEVNNGIDWCGEAANNRHLALAAPGTAVDFIIQPKASHVVVLLPVRYQQTLCGENGTLKGLHNHNCDPAAGRRLINRVSHLLDRYRADPDLLRDAGEIRSAEVDLLDDLGELALDEKTPLGQAHSRAPRELLRRALYQAEQINEKISVPEFAEQLCVSQRSLELAFREFLGVTPKKYLNYRRIHGVHRELSWRPPGSQCVTEVANAWGFTELGRFAGEYRKLFGELPTDTLNRRHSRPGSSLRDLL